MTATLALLAAMAAAWLLRGVWRWAIGQAVSGARDL